MRLKIPQDYRDGFEKLITASDAQVESLHTALQSAPPSIQFEDLIKYVCSAASGIDSSDAELAVRTLVSLYALKGSTGADIPQLVDDVYQAASEEFGDMAVDAGQRFKGRLQRLLSIGGALDTVSKAARVLYDHERVFTGARVLTDVRAVFGADVEKDPVGTVIVEMLRIQYQEHGEEKNFYVAMDPSDLSEFRETLDRADKKTQTLRSVLSRVNLEYLNPA